MPALLSGLFVVALLAAPALARADEAAVVERPALAVGERLPALTLPTLDGERVALDAYRGRKLLLIEFASW